MASTTVVNLNGTEDGMIDISNENAGIVFEIADEGNKKNWNIIRRGGDYEPYKLNMVSSTTTNKFYIIAEFIQDMSCYFGEEFDEWFWNFINSYAKCPLSYDLKDINQIKQQENNRFEIIESNVPRIKEYVKRYIDENDFNFVQFVNKGKMKKGSITFDEDDIRKILTVSGYLKVYSIISNSKDNSLPTYLHKKIYNMLVDDFSGTPVVKKIYDVCRTKTYRYNMTDKYMWEYLREKQSRDPESYIVETFNFIMSHILTLCKLDSNPVTYFVTVVDSGLKWFLRTRYDSYISYSELSSTEDVQSINFDNVKTHSYNTVLNRIREIARAAIDANLERSYPMTIGENGENTFDSALAKHGHILMTQVHHISPIHEFLTFPIFSQVTDIPYIHFRVCSKSMASILSLYLHDLLKVVFPGRFQNLFKLLDYYVDREKDKSVSISTTYTLKDQEVWNQVDRYQNFCTFNSRYLSVKVIEYFIGVLSSCKYKNLKDGKELGSISVRKLEADCIEFYPSYYAGVFEKEILQIREMINSAF